MSRENDERNAVTVQGGTFVGSAIGAGQVDNHATVTAGVVGSGPTVEELRSTLLAARADLMAVGRTNVERALIEDRVSDVITTLEADDPQAEPVQTRWARAREMIDAASASGTAVAGSVTAISEMVRSIFGAP